MRKVFLLSLVLGLVLVLGVGLTVSIINSTNEDIYGDIDGVYEDTWRDYLTLEERIELLESGMEWQEDYIDMLEEEILNALYLMMVYADYESDLRYIRETFYEDEWYDAQRSELYDLYALKLVEEFPEYYPTLDDVSVEDEFLTVTIDDWVVNVTYQALEFTLFIEEIEVCNETCEIVDYKQTDFILTVEELELNMIAYLETLELFN